MLIPFLKNNILPHNFKTTIKRKSPRKSTKRTINLENVVNNVSIDRKSEIQKVPLKVK